MGEKRKNSTGNGGGRREQVKRLGPLRSSPLPPINNSSNSFPPRFRTSNGESKFDSHFTSREIIPGKFIDFDFFNQKQLNVYEIMKDMGWLSLNLVPRFYYPRLVRCFYSNMESDSLDSGLVLLNTFVNGVEIRLSEEIVAEILDVPCRGLKFSSPFRKDEAFKAIFETDDLTGIDTSSVARFPDLPRVLNYIVCSMLLPRSGSLTNSVSKSMFFIANMLQRKRINLPYHILVHMKKASVPDSSMHLPYGVLITRILQYFEVPVAVDECCQLTDFHRIGEPTFEKMQSRSCSRKPERRPRLRQQQRHDDVESFSENQSGARTIHQSSLKQDEDVGHDVKPHELPQTPLQHSQHEQGLSLQLHQYEAGPSQHLSGGELHHTFSSPVTAGGGPNLLDAIHDLTRQVVLLNRKVDNLCLSTSSEFHHMDQRFENIRKRIDALSGRTDDFEIAQTSMRTEVQRLGDQMQHYNSTHGGVPRGHMFQSLYSLIEHPGRHFPSHPLDQPAPRPSGYVDGFRLPNSHPPLRNPGDKKCM